MIRPIRLSPRRLGFAALGVVALAALLAGQLSCSKKTTAPAVETPSCQLSTSILQFGSTPVGSSSTRGFQITNAGGGTLSGSVTAPCAEFALVGSGSYSLGAGQSQSFTIRYTPSGVGADTCHVSTGCQTLVCLGTGTGPAYDVFPDTLTFYRNSPDQRIGFSIQNNGTSRISGTVHSSSPEFSVLFDSTYSLGTGEYKLFQVSFKPAGAGVRTATITTGLSGGNVTCTGIGPKLVVTPASLDLGDSWDRIDKPFTLTNADSFPLSGTITVPCGPFGLVGATSYHLSPGQSLTDTVRYFPPSTAGTQDCRFDLGITTTGPRCHGVSQVLDPVMSDCAAPTTNVLDFGTVTVGQSVSRTLTVLCGGLPDPTAPLCSGILLYYASGLQLDGNASFSNLTPSQRVDFTATYTPTVPGLHHLIIQSWSWNANIAHQVGAYVECRVAAIGS